MSVISVSSQSQLRSRHKTKKLVILPRILGYFFLLLFFFFPRYGRGIPPFVLVAVLSLPYIYTHFARKRAREANWYNRIYCITYIASLFIHYYANSIYSSASFLVYFVLSYIITEQAILTKENFDKAISISIYLFALYAVFGLVESITGTNLFDVLFGRTTHWAGYGLKRYGLYLSTGFMTVMHNNAALMCMGWAIAAYRVCNMKTRKGLWIGLWALIGLGCLTIMSRTIMFTAPILQLIIFRKQGVKWLSRRLMIFVIVILMVVMILGSEVLAPITNTVVGMIAPIVDEIFGTSLKAQVNSTLGGSGQRGILWVWITDAVKNNIFFGKGFTDIWSTTVYGKNYIGQVWQYDKTSIEVHWLRTLYNTGLFGLAGFILYQVGVILKTWKQKVKYFEPKVTFQYTIKWISIFYFFHLFGMSAAEELQFFYLLFALYLSYVYICNHKPANRIRKAGVRYARRTRR